MQNHHTVLQQLENRSCTECIRWACCGLCALTSIGAQAHATASLPAIAHCKDQQLPLHMKHLPIRDQLVPVGVGGSLPVGGRWVLITGAVSAAGFCGLILRGRSLLRVTNLQSQFPFAFCWCQI